jgi:ATP-dependent DNA ligase
MLKSVPLPSDITLMHPTLISRPFHREGWVYEEKYDGRRILARLMGRSPSSVGMVEITHAVSVS